MADYKSAKRWANQMEKGSWTPEKITHTIRHGKQHAAQNLTRGGTPANRYQLGEDFIVVDNKTNEIIQISRPKPGGFIPREF